MWRKFNRSKDPTIGSPTLIDSTLEQEYLDTLPEVDPTRNNPSTGNLPDLPALPCKAVEPSALPDRHLSDHIAFSVYSRSGPDTIRVVSQDSDQMPSVCSEVSPLTSPRTSADFDHGQSPDISPIDALPTQAPDFPGANSKFAPSQLPRRKVPAARDAASPASPMSSSLMPAHCDDVENRQPTLPATASRDEKLAALREKNKKLLSGFQEQSPQDRNEAKKQPFRYDSLDHPVYRPPWKGASGRTALVEPVRNTPRSKNDPQLVSRRKNDGRASNSRTNSPSPAASTQPVKLTSDDVTEPVEMFEDPIKPIVPLKVGNNAQRVVSPVTAENLSGPFNPRYSDTTVRSRENSHSDVEEASDHHAQKESQFSPPSKQWSSPNIHDQPSAQLAEQEPASHFSWTTYATTIPPPPKTPENDPSSRFSWTTVATSVQDSPRSTAPRVTSVPPVPPLPYMPNASAMRKRATDFHSSDLRSTPLRTIHRKPTPCQSLHTRHSSLDMIAGNAVRGRISPTTSEIRPADKSKSLPQCPPEVEAKDRITALEARMDDLTRRRRNITQILTELKNVVQPTSLVYDLATREEGKRTIKGLEDELSDIRVEEHQIGMTLHRALKKRDQENIYGYPTGLWVKRVTS